ncbi:MAG: hypothetical protein KKG92_14860, partial [Gammaproteobacteria bacterium]|nr:hypothetical protein [Gammaproteobacteria bacterium]
MDQPEFRLSRPPGGIRLRATSLTAYQPGNSRCWDEKGLNSRRFLGFREGVTRRVSRRRLGKAQRAQHGDGLLGTLRFAQPTHL